MMGTRFSIRKIAAAALLCTMTLIAGSCGHKESGRVVKLLDEGWKFTRADNMGFAAADYNDASWQTVSIPHDWAIAGPFDMDIDSQKVKVTEDGEKTEKLRTGRTGALPFIGTGWYRYELGTLTVDNGERYRLEFDGAMSRAKIFVNGKLAGERPYGYSSFAVDITDFLADKQKNILAVRLENKEESSRWYPGAGLYRNVRLVKLQPVHIGHWGTYITTPVIGEDHASVNIKTTVENTGYTGKAILRSTIMDKDGNRLASAESGIPDGSRNTVEQEMPLTGIEKWDIENPVLYTAVSQIVSEGKIMDEYRTDFGIRSFSFDPDNGFSLNGRRVPIQGVCLHHDLGPLGAAVNTRAIERQLKLLKEMGCNAIRTSHNPPAPELLDLCDRMGFIVMDESFDEWKLGKNKNGYAEFFDEWAEKDLTAMIHRDRNHPSVMIWSIGNEIREQGRPNGAETAKFLTDICHREDPTRPVTAGLNNYKNAIKNGFGEVLDIVGFNYKPFAYDDVHKEHPDYCLYGSETASTVSSRGRYHFPAAEAKGKLHEDFHCSSYDLEYPGWASTPDTEFAGQDDNPFVAGEFVWTGFDYLGEPTPYNETVSSRSSYFGILDLAGMKKDRFYLYQSRWSDTPVLHILPHWNWKDGDIIPVHCYTNFDEVELFLNGKSLGRKKKGDAGQDTRYRIIWDNIEYEPGELKAVAYREDGSVAMETVMRTAGVPARIELKPDRDMIAADGKDLSFIEISIVDKDGTLCPDSDIRLNFKAEGTGSLVAICNGDPTSLESFCGTTMKAFSGKCVAIIGKVGKTGKTTLSVTAEGLPGTAVTITAENK